MASRRRTSVAQERTPKRDRHTASSCRHTFHTSDQRGVEACRHPPRSSHKRLLAYSRASDSESSL
ncbi:hypothetical protein L210DRAFT_3535560 [Boletus edulis BED1]|nr:hypothetical protein L210DRAFT_3535560 [Boletus edulis BED1]